MVKGSDQRSYPSRLFCTLLCTSRLPQHPSADSRVNVRRTAPHTCPAGE